MWMRLKSLSCPPYLWNQTSLLWIGQRLCLQFEIVSLQLCVVFLWLLLQASTSLFSLAIDHCVSPSGTLRKTNSWAWIIPGSFPTANEDREYPPLYKLAGKHSTKKTVAHWRLARINSWKKSWFKLTITGWTMNHSLGSDAFPASLVSVLLPQYM